MLGDAHVFYRIIAIVVGLLLLLCLPSGPCYFILLVDF
jgi:hypothetical protein